MSLDTLYFPFPFYKLKALVRRRSLFLSLLEDKTIMEDNHGRLSSFYMMKLIKDEHRLQSIS
jgi:hypothetical protein